MTAGNDGNNSFMGNLANIDPTAKLTDVATNKVGEFANSAGGAVTGKVKEVSGGIGEVVSKIYYPNGKDPSTRSFLLTAGGGAAAVAIAVVSGGTAIPIMLAAGGAGIFAGGGASYLANNSDKPADSAETEKPAMQGVGKTAVAANSPAIVKPPGLPDLIGGTGLSL